ncbi:hypothetical protein ACIRP7_24965 [Streptomyces sp. NPDC102270]
MECAEIALAPVPGVVRQDLVEVADIGEVDSDGHGIDHGMGSDAIP